MEGLAEVNYCSNCQLLYFKISKLKFKCFVVRAEYDRGSPIFWGDITALLFEDKTTKGQFGGLFVFLPVKGQCVEFWAGLILLFVCG